jgi:hypothetical protein
VTADPLEHVRAHNPHAGQGAVLLDLGDGVGALIMVMPASWFGRVVDIEADDPEVAHAMAHAAALEHGHGHDHRHDHGHHRPHVAVLPRPVPGGGEVPSLVFPALAEGSYRLFEKGSDVVALTAVVVGGRVTTLEWPG